MKSNQTTQTTKNIQRNKTQINNSTQHDTRINQHYIKQNIGLLSDIQAPIQAHLKKARGKAKAAPAAAAVEAEAA